MLSLLFSFYGLFFGTLCSFKAKQKNRNTKNWFLLGFIFGFVAYIAIMVLHSLSQSNNEEINENQPFVVTVS